MTSHMSPGVRVIDIRRDRSNNLLLETLRRSFDPPRGQSRTFPTLLLYDEKGLKLFEDITYLEEYYLTNSEIETLQTHASDIAARIPAGARLVELGSGNLRKVSILLRAFEEAEKRVDYYALDVSLSELKRTFAQIDTKTYRYVTLQALYGTYDDALSWLAKSAADEQPTCVMTLGSSIGNFSREGAAQFLASFKKVLGSSDLVVVGLDSCQQPERVIPAYNDSEKVTERFYRNGLTHANALLGYEAFKQEEWGIDTLYDEKLNRHQAYYVALKDIQTPDFSVRAGEKLHVEDSYKYSEAESDRLWHDAGLIPQSAYGNKTNDYFIHLLSPATINFSSKPSEYAVAPIPSLNDWRQLWVAWDVVTKSMVPRDELLNKPIKLRNDLIFYLGHIPTFADIHYTRATADKPTDPSAYVSIFERGIDPDVDNPEVCHDHSEIPDTWPPLKDVLDYQHRVRARIVDSLDSGRAYTDRKLGRALWLGYEHEAMHLETFLYMLLQSERVLPPPGQKAPDFKALASQARSKRVQNQWRRIPAGRIQIGLDDAENDLGPNRYFGWDNERPSRSVFVKEFEAQSRPISNGEYARFLEATHKDALPASWTISKADGTVDGTDTEETGADGSQGINGHSAEALDMASSSFTDDKAVRTIYGLVPLKYALDWPVMASYDELVAFANWSNGRIPTFEEARSLYRYVEEEKATVQKVPSVLISAVNGHLSNEGVEETPPSTHSVSKGAVADCDGAPGPSSAPDPHDLFIDLSDHNVAFHHWHPIPVTADGERLCGQSDLGGLWEWTSTALAPHEGFQAMDLYPGYTADFFDGKHNICLGGSWATVPRIAGRKSFINWYQRNYPYVWCTARLVRDVAAPR